jgi:hypothetical protein
MTALLSFLAGKAATYFIGTAIVIGAFVATYVRGRLSGSKAERDKQAASEAKAKTVADEIDDAVAGRSPDANRDALKDWSPR